MVESEFVQESVFVKPFCFMLLKGQKVEPRKTKLG